MFPPFTLDDFDPPPAPPPLLYKYLIADRITNVLDEGTVRFTQLLHTNDSFEVRTTFQRFAGPRFVSLLENYVSEKLTDKYVDERLQQLLLEKGVRGVSVHQFKLILQNQHGVSPVDFMRTEIKKFIHLFAGTLNDKASVEAFLHQLGSQLLCFSLSERYDSNPMWAHYAGDHTGFVVAFDTSHTWFLSKTGAKTRLQKVAYLDGLLDEPLENPQAAFISKTADWSYEREWRLNCGLEDVEKTVGLDSDPIHLLSFPCDAVHSVVVGHKATDDTVERITRSVATNYPKAALFKAQPRRETHTFELCTV